MDVRSCCTLTLLLSCTSTQRYDTNYYCMLVEVPKDIKNVFPMVLLES